MLMPGAPHFLLSYSSSSHLLKSACCPCYSSSGNGEPRDICPRFDALLTSTLAIAVVPN